VWKILPLQSRLMFILQLLDVLIVQELLLLLLLLCCPKKKIPA